MNDLIRYWLIRKMHGVVRCRGVELLLLLLGEFKLLLLLLFCADEVLLFGSGVMAE